MQSLLPRLQTQLQRLRPPSRESVESSAIGTCSAIASPHSLPAGATQRSWKLTGWCGRQMRLCQREPTPRSKPCTIGTLLRHSQSSASTTVLPALCCRV